MGPPGGGRNPITPRIMRHFNYLAFTELEDSSKAKIFSTIVTWWLGQFSIIAVFKIKPFYNVLLLVSFCTRLVNVPALRGSHNMK